MDTNDDEASYAVNVRGADVQLIDANLLWTPNRQMWATSPLIGQAGVEYRKTPSDKTRYIGFAKSWGACAMWSSWSPADRLIELLRIGHVMTAIDGVDPTSMHRAFAVIPEYRRLMARSVPEWADELSDEAHGVRAGD